MDLFERNESSRNTENLPLAARMRPVSIDEIVGQERIIGPGKLLRRAIEADRINSIILYGPPGCGKTSLAEVIAGATERKFVRASGATSNVAELRKILEHAHSRRMHQDVETILFVDEIHRFNKSQQDILLPGVEEGLVTLVGATTHNPMFFINSPLNSRSLIFELDPLSEEGIIELVRRALVSEKGLASCRVNMDEDAMAHLARVCDGDARRALNALEIAVLSTAPSGNGEVRITRRIIEDSMQKKAVVYDHDEDGHYDTISAFIKSVRGSDPHAAVYWLAKMLHAGEDPRFVARRLVILASEDIGNADPRGLTLAVSAMQAVDFVGMPEARIVLSQAATYLAAAPKSNAAYMAVQKAGMDIEEGRTLPVPEHLKNRKIDSAGRDGKRAEYSYPHDYEGAFTEQEYVPSSARYYEPAGAGYEETIVRRLKHWGRL